MFKKHRLRRQPQQIKFSSQSIVLCILISSLSASIFHFSIKCLQNHFHAERISLVSWQMTMRACRGSGFKGSIFISCVINRIFSVHFLVDCLQNSIAIIFSFSRSCSNQNFLRTGEHKIQAYRKLQNIRFTHFGSLKENCSFASFTEFFFLSSFLFKCVYREIHSRALNNLSIF